VVLESISKEAKGHPKLLVQATFNAYAKVVEQDNSGRLNSYCWRFFTQLLRPMLSNLPKDFTSEH
jgi:hypothetical protein